MSAFVLDASMSMSWCFEDEETPYTRRVFEMLRDSYAEVPAVWPFEIANSLTVAIRRKRITPEAADRFLEMLDQLRTSRHLRIEQNAIPITGRDLLPLTSRHSKLSAYDAAYLELAIRKTLPLATLDTDLRDVAISLQHALVQA